MAMTYVWHRTDAAVGREKTLQAFGRNLMTKKATTAAAIERLEGLAADFLESHIADLEKVEDVTVKDVEVAVVPDLRGGDAAVTVVIETAKKPGNPSQP